MNYYNENHPPTAAWLKELIANDHIPPGDVDTRSIADVQPDDLAGYRQCHFFAGIGGWSYALRLAGWPDYRPIWTGSCPCQPFSNAGKRRGTADNRHLWPIFFRLIRQCRPAVVVGEQVTGGIADDWLGSVLDDLEAEDFAVGAIHLPAASVGAPHIRQRAFWVGFTDQSGWGKRNATGETVGFRGTSVATGGGMGDPEKRRWGKREQDSGWSDERNDPQAWNVGRSSVTSGSLGHTISTGLPAPESPSVLGTGRRIEGRATRESGGSFWAGGKWQLGADKKLRWVEPGIRLLAHGVPSRVGLLRGYGNAIVPQAAAVFLRAVADSIQLAVSLAAGEPR